MMKFSISNINVSFTYNMYLDLQTIILVYLDPVSDTRFTLMLNCIFINHIIKQNVITFYSFYVLMINESHTDAPTHALTHAHTYNYVLNIGTIYSFMPFYGSTNFLSSKLGHY